MNNTDEEKEVVEDPKYLLKVRDSFMEQNHSAKVRKDRLEDLMNRKSALKWKPTKVLKMSRRLATATKIQEQSGEIIENINYRLSQIGKPSS